MHHVTLSGLGAVEREPPGDLSVMGNVLLLERHASLEACEAAERWVSVVGHLLGPESSPWAAYEEVIARSHVMIPA